jgi:hypothetical protein
MQSHFALLLSQKDQANHGLLMEDVVAGCADDPSFTPAI